MNSMNLIVLGPQGSGKSTQGQLLAQSLKLPLLDVGSFLREKAREKSDIGRKIKEAVEKGSLVDDFVLTSLLQKELAGTKYRDGVVLDGVPRTLTQAKLFDKIIEIDKVFYLRVPDEVNVERLFRRGREDDTPELIRHRLKLYHENTEPALDYFRQRGILKEIDGTGGIEEVFEKIKESLN